MNGKCEVCVVLCVQVYYGYFQVVFGEVEGQMDKCGSFVDVVFLIGYYQCFYDVVFVLNGVCLCQLWMMDV